MREFIKGISNANKRSSGDNLDLNQSKFRVRVLSFEFDRDQIQIFHH
jgi:hypothetical protein